MSHYKKFETKALSTMATLPEYKGYAVSERKKMIRAVWDHLNNNVHTKGGSVGASKSSISQNVRKAMDITSLMKAGVTAIGLGTAIIPYIL